MSRRAVSRVASPVARSIPIDRISRALLAAGFCFFSVSTAADWHVVTFDFDTCVAERRCLAADVLAEIGYDVAPAGVGTLIVGQPGQARVERAGGVLREYVTAMVTEEPIAA